MKDEPLSTNEQIGILLHEYDTLRNEIISRLSNRFAILALVLAVISYLASTWEKLDTASLIAVAVIPTALMVGVWIRLGFLIQSCAQRLKSLESQINGMASVELLRWESAHASRYTFNRFMRWVFRRDPLSLPATTPSPSPSRPAPPRRLEEKSENPIS